METTETGKSDRPHARAISRVEQVSQGVIRRKYAVFMLALALATTAPSVIEAQAAEKLVRIGMLRPGSPPDPFVETFRQALQDLGYAEGRNLSIEYRWAQGRDERLPELAADLVRLRSTSLLQAGDPRSCRPGGPPQRSRSSCL
jgi:hypothetical protein